MTYDDDDGSLSSSFDAGNPIGGLVDNDGDDGAFSSSVDVELERLLEVMERHQHSMLNKAIIIKLRSCCVFSFRRIFSKSSCGNFTYFY
jgi:hypothetical protein